MSSPPFLCGVIEGFYSRPWNQSQRIDLYSKLESLKLNAYLYAPKDDHKHRALWRHPYNSEEKSELSILIEACEKKNIKFMYGISPGLDMSYSSVKDIDALKQKLEQVKSLGCDSFAILWDDIDTTLPRADQDYFKTLAEAHVKVTNEVFEHLGKPREFLTCPVEYCANRAVPNVEKSEYLNTLGTGLLPSIGVFWTGNRVVSENITVRDLIPVRDALRRKPVIWDNLHANDYDHGRLFLGPFSGRDPSILPHIRGMMTNPNCEYSFNVPALVTMAAWKDCYDEDEGIISSFDPLSVSKEKAVPKFIEELGRETTLGVHSQELKSHLFRNASDRASVELDESDVELLFHFFWLPHSHGPRADMMLNEFKYLRDNAHVMLNSKPPNKNVEFYDAFGPETEFSESWMERATSFNAVVTRFAKLADKLTFIANRELFFDINSYVNNIQVMLQACNRYLKWVGLDRCRKPINGSPTLAGLPGGLAGDLQRLFPAQNNNQFPFCRLVASAEPTSTYTCTPVQTKMKAGRTRIRNAFLRLVSEAVRPKALIDALLAQTDVRALALSPQQGGQRIGACVMATRRVAEATALLRSTMNSDISNEQWTAVERHDTLLLFTSCSELLYTKSAENMLNTLLLLFDCSEACVLVDTSAPLTKAFLEARLGFKEVAKGEKMVLMGWGEEKREEEQMEL